MRRLISPLGVLGLALALVGAPGAAHAQTVPGKSQAKELFEEGIAFEKKGDWSSAAARFAEAAKILPTPGVRYHQGYANEMLGKIATALDYYESASALAREQKKPDVEKATTARAEPLRARAPRLGIRLVTRVDAKVRLDDKDVAQPLLDGTAFRVDPGEHTITATAAGYGAFSRKLTSRESTTTNIDVVLDKASAPTAAGGAAPPASAGPLAATTAEPHPSEPGAAIVADTEPPKEAPARSRTAALLVTGAAAGFVVGGVVSFVLAGSAQSDAEQSCPTKLTCDDEKTKVRTLDTVALVGFVGGAALAATSIVLWTSGPSGHGAGLAPSTRVVAGPSGAAVQGVFW